MVCKSIETKPHKNWAKSIHRRAHLIHSSPQTPLHIPNLATLPVLLQRGSGHHGTRGPAFPWPSRAALQRECDQRWGCKCRKRDSRGCKHPNPPASPPSHCSVDLTCSYAHGDLSAEDTLPFLAPG